MNPLLMTIAAALGVAMILSLYRVLRGPSVFDRLNGLGLIGSKSIVLLLVLGGLSGRIEMFVDIALAYAMITFVGSLALAKYSEQTRKWR